MQQPARKPLFDLGQLVATPGALAALEKSGQSPMDFISRHVTGDWGEIPEEDKEKTKMNTAVAVNTSKTIPLAMSAFQDIPLNRIQESQTNPRRTFDEAKLA